MNAEDECPFCFIERNVEQDIMDYVLGSCASYMESDTREATDKAGFCRMHNKKMFDYGNTLGNGWILKTHYKKLIAEMTVSYTHLDVYKRQVEAPVGRVNNIPVFTGCEYQRILRLVFSPAHKFYINGGIDFRLQAFVDFGE